MLDNYWIGNIDRISPEAPVPVFTVSEKQSRPGGAANVALNCKSLGAQVSLLTVIGKDEQGKALISALNKEGIDSSMCMQSADRITTSKTRVLCKNQQSIRIDEEMEEELSIKDEHCWIGELDGGGGRKGWFPAKFVELIDERNGKLYSKKM